MRASRIKAFCDTFGTFGRFLRNSAGATALEYAFVTPVLLLLILGGLEYNLIMYASAVIEGATTAAGRLAKTGYNNTSTSGIPAWAANTSYTAGQMVNNGGSIYICSMAGRSGSSGPTGTSTTGIADGGAQWVFTCDSSSQARADYIKCFVQQRVKGLLNPLNIAVSAKSYAQFNQVGEPEPYTDVTHVGHYAAGDPYTDVNGNGQWDADMGTAGLGNAGDIVVYTVSYQWPIFTPMVQQFFGNNGSITLSSSAVVKNEPYGTSSSR